MASETDRTAIEWLARLRWAAVLGQVTTIAVATWGFGVQLPLASLAGVVGVQVAVNVACRLLDLRGELAIVAMLAFDAVILAALLYLTGGPNNPFSFLFVVHIALAAATLPPRRVWPLAALSTLLFAGLFVDHVPLDVLTHDAGAHHASAPAEELALCGDEAEASVTSAHAAHLHAQRQRAEVAGLDAMALHVWGMWLAFIVAAVFIVYFLGRIRGTLARRERELLAARAEAARGHQLASLATLAAGAVHEMSTPLGTIAVVARELDLELERDDRTRELAEDARLIRTQVELCRRTLGELSASTGQGLGESAAPIELEPTLRALLDEFAGELEATLVLDEALCESPVWHYPTSFGHVVRAILRNAAASGPAPVEVEVRGARESGGWSLSIRDAGSGMAPEVLARATEPYFSTRPPGEGMGLGLFLARTVTEQMGGAMSVTSQPGQGTTVTLRVPDAPPAWERAT